ncbi:FKBP-type peptidyl-prolyl cis-trans isomerase N-terminal domain-containing protein [Serratia proteamaculans]|uniref:peptidylprolyl isomerase n=1 Tax=Serratia proteamaculans TaxID=28151 RepID=A0A5Q2V890_SERPR|nr:FKBP-type peptidyl-prolyl cis-trans isomerase N-terminal domain-containing protein [Serratia proteamaculans]QGH60608.1 hypothetical protein GHV41_07025 [Serratia proteamaculans]
MKKYWIGGVVLLLPLTLSAAPNSALSSLENIREQSGAPPALLSLSNKSVAPVGQLPVTAQMLAKENARLRQRQVALKQQLQTLNEMRQARDRLQEQLEQAVKQGDRQSQLEQELLQRQQEIQQLTQTLGKQKKTKQLDNELAKRDYAIGTALGKEVQALLLARESAGIKVAPDTALLGIADAIDGKYRLPQAQISKSLHNVELAINKGSQQQKDRAEQEGKRYRQKFATGKNVKKAAEGYWYQIAYVGKGKLKPDDNVAVSVKESLPDGKVIGDMDLAGTYVTQPLKDFPPLFRSALMKLENHGEITLVAPPELAYGDRGSPPDIPPGATMIYHLRILDMKPAAEGGVG